MKLATFQIFILLCCIESFAQTPKDSFNHYMSELKKITPFTNQTYKEHIALVDKIIELSKRVRPLPPIPEEARGKKIMALTLLKDAKNLSDYEQPIAWLKEARAMAPWWKDIYKDVAMTQEICGGLNPSYYRGAISNFEWYLLLEPSAEERRKVQDEIYILNAKVAKASKDSADNLVIAKAAEEKKKEEENLAGEWLDSRGEVFLIISKTNNGYKGRVPNDGEWIAGVRKNGDAYEDKTTLTNFWTSGKTLHYEIEQYIHELRLKKNGFFGPWKANKSLVLAPDGTLIDQETQKVILHKKL